MRLTSSIKDIHKIAEFLQHFELSVILPSLRQKIEWGQQVDSGAISQDAAHIYCGRTVIEKPLKTPPSITKGIMTLYFQTPDGKARKCKVTWRDIWNPFATCELFTKAQNRGPQRFNTNIATVYYPVNQPSPRAENRVRRHKSKILRRQGQVYILFHLEKFPQTPEKARFI